MPFLGFNGVNMSHDLPKYLVLGNHIKEMFLFEMKHP